MLDDLSLSIQFSPSSFRPHKPNQIQVKSFHKIIYNIIYKLKTVSFCTFSSEPLSQNGLFSFKDKSINFV